MFNNISNENSYNSQLGNASNIINLNAIRANLQKTGYATNPYVDKSIISTDAIDLYQKDLDIAKFTKIATSDSDDTSHLDKMEELFADGIIDAFDEDVLLQLVTNSKLWNDLEL